MANESVIDHSKEGLKHHKITEQKGFTYKPVNVDELREAEKEIIRKVQNKAFGHEIALLRHLNVAQTSTDAREIGNQNRKAIKKVQSTDSIHFSAKMAFYVWASESDVQVFQMTLNIRASSRERVT